MTLQETKEYQLLLRFAGVGVCEQTAHLIHDLTIAFGRDELTLNEIRKIEVKVADKFRTEIIEKEPVD